MKICHDSRDEAMMGNVLMYPKMPLQMLLAMLSWSKELLKGGLFTYHMVAGHSEALDGLERRDCS